MLPTVLVAHDLHTYDQRLFSTNASEDFDTWAVAMGSAAAPTYFKPQDIFPKLADGTYAPSGYFVSDGATCMNDPALGGIALIRDYYGSRENREIPLESIEILSLGTGDLGDIRENSALRRGGALNWIPELADLFGTGQESSDQYILKNYFGAQYHRFNPTLESEIKLDDISENSKRALLNASIKMFEDTRKDDFNAVVEDLKARAPQTLLPPTCAYEMIPTPKTFFQQICNCFSNGLRYAWHSFYG